MTPQPPGSPPQGPQQGAPPPAAPAPPPPPPKPAAQKPLQKDAQLRWPKAERQRLASRIQSDYASAIGDHNTRITRWREYYRRWRAVADAPAMGEETASNVPVPLIRWNIFTKWAKEMDALYGDDAEIVAVPVGPSDYKKDKKISRYMTWRVFNSMKLLSPFCEFVLRKLIFGKSIAFSPWKRETYNVKGHDVVDYEGPDFQPLWPDDVIVPAEEVKTLHEFSFLIRRVPVTPDDLLRGEKKGRYQGIKANWETILNLAQHGQRRDFQGEEIRREKDDAEGVNYNNPQSSGEWVTVLEWYGKWRPLKAGKRDVSEWDFDGRAMFQQEYVVRYLRELDLVIGIQSLEELYPTMKNRRPFVESSMCKDGTYWSPGMAEMLIDLEDELRVNHNLSTESAQLAATPMVAYRPASGLTADTFKVEPGLFVPVDDPSRDVRVIEIPANLEAATWKEQVVLGYTEKLTGLSDMQMGRQSDRPNAPRTATQTVKLLEEGNVRISLDSKVLREDMSLILAHFWQLEFMFSPPQTFFRVTEEDDDGLFEVNNGASVITLEDRDGRYDFKLEFANSVWSKEMKKEQSLARYQLDLQNPLIMQNPRALWQVTKDAHEALGDPNFGDMVPEPPAPDIPVDPREEWVRMQEGEEVHINPMDNDQVHMIRHYRDAVAAQNDRNADPKAQKQLHAHYLNHIAQLQQKKLQQAIIENMVQQAGAMAGQAGGDPLTFVKGLFGNAPQQPAGNPQATGPNLYSGHPENLHGAS